VINGFNEPTPTLQADESPHFPTSEGPVTPYSSSSFSQSQQGGTAGYPQCPFEESPHEPEAMIVYIDEELPPDNIPHVHGHVVP